MEPFVCPACRHKSTFDPLAGPAVCPNCGYSPPSDRRVFVDPVRKGERQKRARRSDERTEVGLDPLRELLSHWDGSHVPESTAQVLTSTAAYALFDLYERTLGEASGVGFGSRAGFVRSRRPEKKAIVDFVSAYLLLKQGQRARAAEYLHDLTRTHSAFPDPWIWLTATTDDPAERLEYLENAVVLEPAHPLARDALAIAQGKVSLEKIRKQRGPVQQAQVADCPQCGGEFHYEAGAAEVTCVYCGHGLVLEATNLIHGRATLLGDLQLRRRLEGHAWQEVERLVRCESCGAELTMTSHLVKQCVFCGSTNVLAQDSRRALERPDGFLPFRLGEEQSRAAIDRALRSRSQRLRSWWAGAEREVRGLQAVYLPFWIFDGFVEVRKPTTFRSTSSELPEGLSPWLEELGMLEGGSGAELLGAGSGDRQEHLRPVLDKQLLLFDNLLYSAMDSPPPRLLKELLPYELSVLVPYEPMLLADWAAALYQRDVEAVAKEAYDAMLLQAAWKKKRLALSQTADPAELRRTFQVTTVSYQLLLPVWVALAEREASQRLVLVNGQSGKVVFSSRLRRKTPR